MKIKSLGLKVSLIVLLVIAVLIVVIIINVSSNSSELILELTAREARAANVTFGKEMQNMLEDAYSRANIIAYSNDVVDGILNDDHEALRAALTSYSEGFEYITVTDPDGNVLARMHNDQRGDNIMNQQALSTALTTGTGGSSLDTDAGGLVVRGSEVIHDNDGNIIGGVICDKNLAEPKYVDYIKEVTNSETTLFVGDMRLSSTLMDTAGQRVVGTRSSSAVADTVLNQQQELSMQLELFGRQYYAHYSPLSANGQVVGMLFNGVLIDEALAGQRSMVNTVIMLGVICGVAGVAIVFIFNIFAVSKPLKKIGAFAEKLKNGDLGISSSSTSTIAVRSSDEVGMMARSLEQAYSQLKGYVGEIKERMQGLADGDLITESTYEFSGDFVLIKESINDIIVNLNRTMSEINSASGQVSTGSKQIADGAQSLAQGTTEQAASIQQLSSSISEIAEKTKTNAEMAGRAATLASTIMQNAEKGSSQMDEMTTAVEEINQASQSISKVIKTIDDIAFQTNILALNAAVEAARAGQHGKGFAVVAEEVRNLASKSADAAKETGEMIQNSMEKAELGARIAGETAASLTDIVSGISESNLIVGDIAKSSEEQSVGIAQINTGIDQVAQVVQQNSATAEESAAASEEMSGQSDMLEQLIAQFKLSDGNRAYQRLPQAGSATREKPPTPPESKPGNFGKY